MSKTINQLMREVGPNWGGAIDDPHRLGGLVVESYRLVGAPWQVSLGDSTPILEIVPAREQPSGSPGWVRGNVCLCIEDGPGRRWDSRAAQLDYSKHATEAERGPRPRERWVLNTPV